MKLHLFGRNEEIERVFEMYNRMKLETNVFDTSNKSLKIIYTTLINACNHPRNMNKALNLWES